MALSLGNLVDMASGVLFAALAVLVWRLGSAHKANRAFAAFALVLGAFLVEANLITLLDAPSSGISQAIRVGAILLALATVTLIVHLRSYLPWPVTDAEASAVGWVRFVPALAATTQVILFWTAFGYREALLDPFSARPIDISSALFLPVASGIAYLAAWMPIRYTQADNPREAHHAALLGVALALWPVLQNGVGFGAPPASRTHVGAALLIGTLAGLWLRAMVRARPRPARTSTLLVLGVALAATLAGSRWGPGTVLTSGLQGLTRAIAVLVIAYGILRHQLLGIDITVKKGIRRSTLAAVFVAVFFVASEGAQVVFAGFAGNEIVGVIAAGALVFALAPLQRFAESVADTAMPYVADPEGMVDDERLAIYRRQAEVAWSDGSLTPDERAMLDDLRDQLGLEGDQAAEVESTVAEDVGGGA